MQDWLRSTLASVWKRSQQHLDLVCKYTRLRVLIGQQAVRELWSAVQEEPRYHAGKLLTCVLTAGMNLLVRLRFRRPRISRNVTPLGSRASSACLRHLRWTAANGEDMETAGSLRPRYVRTDWKPDITLFHCIICLMLEKCLTCYGAGTHLIWFEVVCQLNNRYRQWTRQ